MAARLTWSRGCLMLGQIEVAATTGWDDADGIRFRPSGGDWSERYQSPSDMQQDCESDVRRLLKEAGCEVEP